MKMASRRPRRRGAAAGAFTIASPRAGAAGRGLKTSEEGPRPTTSGLRA